MLISLFLDFPQKISMTRRAKWITKIERDSKKTTCPKPKTSLSENSGNQSGRRPTVGRGGVSQRKIMAGNQKDFRDDKANGGNSQENGVGRKGGQGDVLPLQEMFEITAVENSFEAGNHGDRIEKKDDQSEVVPEVLVPFVKNFFDQREFIPFPTFGVRETASRKGRPAKWSNREPEFGPKVSDSPRCF